jgi:hypothetical protein
MSIGSIGKLMKATCCIPINTVGGVLFMGAVEIGACAIGGYVEEKVREKTQIAWYKKLKQEQLARAKAAQEAEEDDFDDDWDEGDDEEDEE